MNSILDRLGQADEGTGLLWSEAGSAVFEVGQALAAGCQSIGQSRLPCCCWGSAVNLFTDVILRGEGAGVAGEIAMRAWKDIPAPSPSQPRRETRPPLPASRFLG